MNIKTFKSLFFNELKSLYPQEEITSFFVIICEHFLQMNRVEMALAPEKVLPLEAEQQMQLALNDLKKQIPIQYSIGETEFFGLPFQVNPSVLIPRPETEELVSWIIDDFSENTRSILDIGTGSGCIAIALAANVKHSKVTALDVSSEALKTAKKNAQLNKVEISFLEKNILKTEILHQKWDVIVSNPPYIKDEEKVQMSKNVLQNEPHLALFVPNTEPLLFYSAIAKFAKQHLNLYGNLYFEIHENQGNAVLQMLKEEGFLNMEIRKDLFGKDRMVKAIWKG